MPTEKNLLDMMEIVSIAIEIHGKEADFFLRSSNASPNEATKAILLEIADDVGHYREKLEARRQKLRDELISIQAAQRERA